MTDSTKRRVAIIGGGIVGLSTALRLGMEGWHVDVFDAATPMQGCSYGNAGCLSEANIFPPVTVETLLQLPSLLASRDGPLVIRPGYIGPMLAWMRMSARTIPSVKREACIQAMAAITAIAVDRVVELARLGGASDLVAREGLLVACRTDKALALRAKRMDDWARAGIRVRTVDAREMCEISPTLRPDLSGGLFFEGSGICMDPELLGLRYAQRLQALGGSIIEAEIREIRPAADSTVSLVGSHGSATFDKVVVCAGHRSKALLAGLGVSVPMACERGYHLMLPSAAIASKVPVIFGEPYFAATPMLHGLRLAGTAEFSQPDAPANWERAWQLAKQADGYMTGIDSRGAKPWMGIRPTMPDGMPAIGTLVDYPQVHYAFGHGHNGLTLSAVTAQCVSALVHQVEAPIEMAPFSLERFQTRSRGARPLRHSAT